jgi:tubby-related protein 1
VGKDLFNVDFAWPMSPYQAFAICLSSFDYKFACE